MSAAAFDLDAAQGMLLGLAVGDAIGTTVEFRARDTFSPVTDMVGGGPFKLEPGQWTDDTAMAFCLAESLIARRGWDANDCMNRFVSWWQDGYGSCTGRCFDIGNATARALGQYLSHKDPYAGSTDPNSSGNGGIMRLAPAVIAYSNDPNAALECAVLQSRTTHASQDCLELAGRLAVILHSGNLDAGDLAYARQDQIRSSGYVRHTLDAAIWSVATTPSFQAAVLKAVNLGDDADTVGAVTGQIAGRLYGLSAIPEHWLDRLSWRDDLLRLATQLYQMDITPPTNMK